MKILFSSCVVVAVAGLAASVGHSEESFSREFGVHYTQSYLKNLERQSPPKHPAPTAPTNSQKAQYHGGPVLSNVKVASVIWGQGVDPAVVSGLGSFFKTLLASTYYNWLTEYDTPKQKIGRGSFEGQFAITPNEKGSTVTDDQIQSEIERQIADGKLPKADSNTVYAIAFPKGVTIDGPTGVGTSCQSFCAYHSSFRTAQKELLFYAILPDASDPICLSDCGPATTNFQVITTDASHEIGEAITDPDVGAGGTLAWNLPDGSEIGDPQACVTKVSNIQGSNGTKFQVQALWSSKRQACVFN